MNKKTIIDTILDGISYKVANASGFAFAPTNIALCKYWGKRNEELNLPVTSSLSLTISGKGAFTRIMHCSNQDNYIVGGKAVDMQSVFAVRLKKFLDLFRAKDIYYQVETALNIPVAAGLASSACGFAALVSALNNLYAWNLDKQQLSILARLGSGSASRSFWPGFVEWQAGENSDGMDSFGVPIPCDWTELRLGILVLSTAQKQVSSREAMRRTVQESSLYDAWPEQVANDLSQLKQAITEKDLELLGLVAEANAAMMHEMMQSLNPPINYFLPETIEAIDMVQRLRSNGLQIYYTQDAGPNLELIFSESDVEHVKELFPNIEIIAPFANQDPAHVVLVTPDDVPIGIAEKIEAHVSGKLHRAFSVFVLRYQGDIMQVLLQKRKGDKYHSGGLWSNTCCGHPRFNEDITIAAEKRLQEEMGFATRLQNIGKFCYDLPAGNGLREHELDHVFVGIENIEEPDFNPNEVEEYRWVSLDELQSDLSSNPLKYTPWLPMALEILLEKISQIG